jgi:peptidoglycan/LPS O-acetylase OafA/YrhL
MASLTTRPRLLRLTSLRALAASLVFLAHVSSRLGGDPARALHYLTLQAGMCLTFFFALSGFIMTWAHRPGEGARTFYRRRFARVYPAYFLALLFATALTVASHGRSGVSAAQYYGSSSELVGPFLAQVAMVQAWTPDSHYFFSLNGVGWSLSCEVFMYACFPLLVGWAWRLSQAQRRAVQVGCLLLAFAFAALVSASPSDTTEWLQSHMPMVRLLEFVVGITVGIDVLNGQWRRVPLGPSLALFAALYVAAGIWPNPYTLVALPMVPLLLIMVAACWYDIDGKRGFLTTRPMVWLGDLSFCFYLVHQTVIRLLGGLGKGTTWAGAAPRVLVALALSLLVATALHLVVERPMERRLRGAHRPRPPVTVGSPA